MTNSPPRSPPSLTTHHPDKDTAMPRRKSPASHLSVEDILRDAIRNPDAPAQEADDTGPAHNTGSDQRTGSDPNTGPDQNTGPTLDFHVYQAVDAIIHTVCEGFGLPSSLEMALREVGTLAARRVLHPPPAPPPDPLAPIREVLRLDDDRSKAVLEGTARLALRFGVNPEDIDARIHVYLLNRARLEAQVASDLLALVGAPRDSNSN